MVTRPPGESYAWWHLELTEPRPLASLFRTPVFCFIFTSQAAFKAWVASTGALASPALWVSCASESEATSLAHC